MAKDLSDYYTAAKSAIDIGIQLGMVLGWIAKNDPNGELFNRIHDDLINLAEGVDWAETMDFIAPYHARAARAITALADNKTNALNDRNYPTRSEEGPTVFAGYEYTIAPFYRPYDSKTALWSKAFFDYTLDKQPGNTISHESLCILLQGI